MYEKASTMLKAVAHPVRLSLLNLLGSKKKLCVTEIFEELNIEQAVASHHLSILKDRDVVVCERNGKNSYYSLKNPRMIEIVDCIQDCCTN